MTGVLSSYMCSSTVYDKILHLVADMIKQLLHGTGLSCSLSGREFESVHEHIFKKSIIR